MTRLVATMERVVLVHGSVVGGRGTWSLQRRGLGDRLDLVVLERPGFPPNPPVDSVDFELEARSLAEHIRLGDHLVGHSYGGVISLLTAAAVGDRLGSLTVIEPPCTQVAKGITAVDAFAEGGRSWWSDGPRDDPETYLRGFLRSVGSTFEPPSPLPPDLAQGARTLLVERGPWEAQIPLGRLAGMAFPKLVVSGAHHPAFEAICDVLERELAAERLVYPGYGHAPQRHPGFNEAFAEFVERASRAS